MRQVKFKKEFKLHLPHYFFLHDRGGCEARFSLIHKAKKITDICISYIIIVNIENKRYVCKIRNWKIF